MSAANPSVTIPLTLVIVAIAIPACLTIAKKCGWLYDRNHIVNRLRVASVTMQADLDPQVNRQRMIARVQSAKQAYPEVELVLFGETILGFSSRRRNELL
jgi:hypothetical protein